MPFVLEEGGRFGDHALFLISSQQILRLYRHAGILSADIYSSARARVIVCHLTYE